MNKPSSQMSLSCAAILALFAGSSLLTQAQMDAGSTNAAPAMPPPAPAPAATPAPAMTTPPETPAAPAAPAGDRPATYTIASGDSLWTIAHKYGTTVVKLRKLNGLKKGALLHPGQVIKLPPGKVEDSSAAAQ